MFYHLSHQGMVLFLVNIEDVSLLCVASFFAIVLSSKLLDVKMHTLGHYESGAFCWQGV